MGGRSVAIAVVVWTLGCPAEAPPGTPGVPDAGGPGADVPPGDHGTDTTAAPESGAELEASAVESCLGSAWTLDEEWEQDSGWLVSGGAEIAKGRLRLDATGGHAFGHLDTAAFAGAFRLEVVVTLDAVPSGSWVSAGLATQPAVAGAHPVGATWTIFPSFKGVPAIGWGTGAIDEAVVYLTTGTRYTVGLRREAGTLRLEVRSDASGAVVGTLEAPDALGDAAFVAIVAAAAGGEADARVQRLSFERCVAPAPACYPAQCPSSDACDRRFCNPLVGCGEISTAGACDDDIACTVDACDPASGCSNLAKDVLCLDTDVCNGQETCDVAAKGCAPGTALACNDLDPCNGLETCDPLFGCQEGPKPANCCLQDTDCDDLDPCNGTGYCNEALNECVEIPALVCTDNDPCNGTEICDPKTGACAVGVALGCDDGNFCTGKEICVVGKGCAVGAPPVCTDGDPCNGLESCDPISGCKTGDDLACDDENLCNGEEYCVKAIGCVPGSPPTCSDGDPCNGPESCDESAGCVSGAPLACDDKLECNGIESCKPGVGCVVETGSLGGCCTTKADCEDGNPCNGIGVCDTETKTCVVQAPIACDDGKPCNGAEYCDPIVGCMVGSPKVCDDGNVCNGVESCDNAAGCKPGTGALACDDGLVCTGAESCHPELGCLQGAAPPGCCQSDGQCEDNNACNGVGTCHAQSGSCVVQLASKCDDGNPCNGAEHCDETKGCLVGTPLPCNDQNPCNGLEGCDAKLGCTVLNPDPCSDGNACNGFEGCDDAVGCLTGAPLGCDDGSACNGLESCDPLKGCVPDQQKNCDDALSCTHDYCDPQTGGCHNDVEGGWCLIDGKACVGDGQVNPANPCQRCDVSKTVGSYLNDDSLGCGPLQGAAAAACKAGVCVVTGCAAGWADCDGDGLSCEQQTVASVEHCGACQKACGGAKVAEAACEASTCKVKACEAGWADANHDAEDGCEAPELWVDAANAADTAQDGSKEHPFATILAGYNAATPGHMIRVKPGTYSGTVNIAKAGMTIEGAGTDQVFIVATTGGKGFYITAPKVTLRGFSLSNGFWPIHVSGDALLKLDGVLIEDVAISSVFGADESNQDVAPIIIDNGRNTVIRKVFISDVKGSKGIYHGCGGCGGESGRHGTGIWLRGCVDPVVEDCTLKKITGGDGGAGNGAGASAGYAIGIRADSTTGCVFKGNLLSALTGGTGGGGGGYGGRGGFVYAMLFSANTSGCVLDDNAMTTLKGGPGGGAPQPGGAGGAYGLVFDGTSATQAVDLSNSVEGDPVVFLYDAHDVEVSGLSLKANALPTNYGKVVVINSSGVTLSNLVLANGTAGGGSGGNPAGDGLGWNGVFLSGCQGCEVTDSLVENFAGGQGGAGTSGGAGGPARGIYITASTDVWVANNVIRSIEGGKGGLPDYEAVKGGAGGAAMGVRVDNSQAVVLDGNEIAYIYGGDRANSSVANGGGYGIYMTACTDCALDHELVSWIFSSKSTTGTQSACAYVADSPNLLLEHLTCAQVSIQQGNVGYGVMVGPGQFAPLQVKSSILAGINGTCLWSNATNFNVFVIGAYSLLDGCETQGTNVTLGSTLLTGDPLFASPELADFHVLPGSPAIDAAEPKGDCSQEPAPNGCRAEMGAYGGTDEATPSAADALHCAEVCPAP